jgi:hypothetical protein
MSKYYSPTQRRMVSRTCATSTTAPQYRNFSKPPQLEWKGDYEEPSTSGTDECSPLPAGHDDSKYVKRKYRSSHFGGLRNS